MPDPGSGPQSSGAQAPKPMPFAVMRNSHEALRASIRLQEQKLEAGDVRGLGDEWRTFQRGLAVHMAMEDKFMFGLLDEVGAGAISAAGVPAEHVEDMRLAKAVDAALAAGDADALRRAWPVWRDDHLHHLSHEEDVMMPLTMKTASTPEARARVFHDRVLTPSEKLPDFDWYIGWVVRMLSDHATTAQPASTAVRVFAWGLQHACSPAQWRRLGPIVRQSCAPPVWTEIAAQFGLEGEGKISS